MILTVWRAAWNGIILLQRDVSDGACWRFKSGADLAGRTMKTNIQLTKRNTNGNNETKTRSNHRPTRKLMNNSRTHNKNKITQNEHHIQEIPNQDDMRTNGDEDNQIDTTSIQHKD
jgi:hypothetical protein